MIRSISIVLAISMIGDAIADMLQLPVPGAAIGLLLLAVLFVLRGGPDEDSAKLFDTISPVFPLFFIPAAVGIIANIEILARTWFFMAFAVVLGTAATLAVTGLIAQALLRTCKEARIP